MSLGLALIAGAVEAGVGYPDTLYRAIGHPVTWIGRLIAWADNRWNSEEDTDVQQRVRGIVLTATLAIGGLLIGLLISRLFYPQIAPRRQLHIAAELLDVLRMEGLRPVAGSQLPVCLGVRCPRRDQRGYQNCFHEEILGS